MTTDGSGRAVQWGSYDWMSHSVLGPVHGLDDVMWRSLVWAAHKPFVMQALPPIVTMRVDDEQGSFDWVHSANDFGFKPWLGLFIDEVSDANAADLSALTNAGQATASIHAFSYDRFLYFDHAAGQGYLRRHGGGQLRLGHGVASTARRPHLQVTCCRTTTRLGSNVFGGLGEWGVEFVGTVMQPGDPYYGRTGPPGSLPSLRVGSRQLGRSFCTTRTSSPCRATRNSTASFFDCVTEIRDENGYEWYPTNDVAATIGHGTAQVARALDSRALGTLFTHGTTSRASPPRTGVTSCRASTRTLPTTRPSP